MVSRLARANLAANDAIFGLGDSGGMTRTRVLNFLSHLPPGANEIYFHPDASTEAGREELAALTDKEVAAAARRPGLALISFTALAAA